MSSPIRRLSIRSVRVTTALRSSTRGCSTCRRLNASSWRVSAAARSVAAATSSRSVRSPSSAPTSSRIANRVRPAMIVSRLLKSWATPPASCPTASIRCECRSCSSRSSRSVRSSTITITNCGRRCASTTSEAATWPRTSAPSLRTSVRCPAYAAYAPPNSCSSDGGLGFGADVREPSPDELVLVVGDAAPRKRGWSRRSAARGRRSPCRQALPRTSSGSALRSRRAEPGA